MEALDTLETYAFPLISTFKNNWQLDFKSALNKNELILLGSDDYLKSLFRAIEARSLRRLIELFLLGSSGKSLKVSSEKVSKLLSLPLFQKELESIDPAVLLLVSSKILGFNGLAGVIFSAYRLLKSGVEVRPIELHGSSGLILRLLK
jgi:hypothetical protein